MVLLDPNLVLPMSVPEKFSSLLSCSPAREVDPLLKDLNEKKQSFRRNVVSLAAELKEARNRLSSQEESFAKEAQTRQACDVGCFEILGHLSFSILLFIFQAFDSINRFSGVFPLWGF